MVPHCNPCFFHMSRKTQTAIQLHSSEWQSDNHLGQDLCAISKVAITLNSVVFNSYTISGLVFNCHKGLRTLPLFFGKPYQQIWFWDSLFLCPFHLHHDILRKMEKWGLKPVKCLRTFKLLKYTSPPVNSVQALWAAIAAMITLHMCCFSLLLLTACLDLKNVFCLQLPPDS